MIPKWELATFLAAICSQLYRPIANMVVTDRANNQWPQIMMPLTDWAASVGATRYFIRWAPGKDTANRQSCAAFLITRVIPAEVLQYLNEDNNVIVPAMTACISGAELNPSENPIARIVAPIMTRVIQEDVTRNSRNYGNYSLGIHLEPHLIDAMRRLIRSGKWSVNTKGSRVWVGKDGVYIAWGAGAKEIVTLLTADSFVGLPQDPDTLADILIDAQVLSRHYQTGRYWAITLPESGVLIDNAVKLANDQLIFPARYDLSVLRTMALAVGESNPELAETPQAEEDAPKQRRAKKKKDAVAAGVDQANDRQEATTPDAVEPGVDDGVEGEKSTANSSPPVYEQPVSDAAASNCSETVDTTGHGRTHAEAIPEQKEATANPPVVDREKNHDKKQAANEVLSANAANAEVNEKFLSMLSRESQWLTKQIVKAKQKATLTGVVAYLDVGVGISAEELSAHGMPTTDFLNELSSRNWLWIDKSKPLKKIHRVEVSGKVESLIIIQPHVARGLGFDWQAPVSSNGTT